MDLTGTPRDRTDLLLDAVITVSRGLDLETVLHRIVETAVELVDARYGALGVLGADGRIARFLTVGLTDEQIAAIGPYPTGHGVLGELIRNPVPLRLHDLAAHPASVGFPAHHPPMNRFVGMPLRVRGAPFGNLYLTDKHGGGDFTAEDQRVLEALAAAASVAVENARLYDVARLRERWARANDRISRQVLAGSSPDDVLTLIGSQAREVADADLTAISVPDPLTGRLMLQTASGLGTEAQVGSVLSADGTFAALTFRTGVPMVTDDAATDERAGFALDLPVTLGPLAVWPLGEPGSARGVLAAARVRGQEPFSSVVVEALSAFAAQGAVALELAEGRADAERVVLLRDRERIARDLHDLAIQRLYATGLSLQRVARTAPPQVAEQLNTAVDELDETISLVRTTIYRLQSDDGSGGASGRRVGLRSRVITEVDAVATALGFPARLRFAGAVDTLVPPDTAEHVVAVLREALSNVARHASASRAEVRLAVADDLVLTVSDDGTGIPPGAPHSGLRNLARRADELGGSLEVGPGDRDADRVGTRLVWRVPLPTDLPTDTVLPA
ncbi:histidine kinase/DNA gyrase B/HSP90-like ATPase [Promicromonospora sp. AC04]|uniref:sensor histidine kinase n=1 Tax=Promicromonospora sp. AC04 TaxID=2135723 RepID=UPI000D3AA755|nr:GAF domain-containing sensor histidine kinase [Promicromonospora sp. AC04]PUB27575.1 histidine kinase/DNA gyrase B/HSP90-like ATPase [Promicromonospora sp. AC04]